MYLEEATARAQVRPADTIPITIKFPKDFPLACLATSLRLAGYTLRWIPTDRISRLASRNYEVLERR